MRHAQTVSTSWRTNWSCTTRRTTHTMEDPSPFLPHMSCTTYKHPQRWPATVTVTCPSWPRWKEKATFLVPCLFARVLPQDLSLIQGWKRNAYYLFSMFNEDYDKHSHSLPKQYGSCLVVVNEEFCQGLWSFYGGGGVVVVGVCLWKRFSSSLYVWETWQYTFKSWVKFGLYGYVRWSFNHQFHPKTNIPPTPPPFLLTSPGKYIAGRRMLRSCGESPSSTVDKFDRDFQFSV